MRLQIVCTEWNNKNGISINYSYAPQTLALELSHSEGEELQCIMQQHVSHHTVGAAPRPTAAAASPAYQPVAHQAKNIRREISTSKDMTDQCTLLPRRRLCSFRARNARCSHAHSRFLHRASGLMQVTRTDSCQWKS